MAVNIVLITGWRVMGLKFPGSDAEPLLQAKTVTPFFHLLGKLWSQQYANILVSTVPVIRQFFKIVIRTW